LIRSRYKISHWRAETSSPWVSGAQSVGDERFTTYNSLPNGLPYQQSVNFTQV